MTPEDKTSIYKEVFVVMFDWRRVIPGQVG